MNSASLVRFPEGNKRQERRAGGLSPPRQLQIEQTGAGSTTACTSPRTRWRSLRVSAVHVSALRVRVSVCVGSAANGIRLRLCAARLRVCLGRIRRCACRVLRPLRTPGRPRAGAVARVPFGRCHIHALRATWTSASRFEVRGRRVCRTSCVRVWSHAVQRVLCVFCVFCVFCVSP